MNNTISFSDFQTLAEQSELSMLCFDVNRDKLITRYCNQEGVQLVGCLAGNEDYIPRVGALRLEEIRLWETDGVKHCGWIMGQPGHELVEQLRSRSFIADCIDNLQDERCMSALKWETKNYQLELSSDKILEFGCTSSRINNASIRMTSNNLFLSEFWISRDGTQVYPSENFNYVLPLSVNPTNVYGQVLYYGNMAYDGTQYNSILSDFATRLVQSNDILARAAKISAVMSLVYYVEAGDTDDDFTFRILDIVMDYVC